MIALGANHETLCRFASEDDENYKHVSALIVDLASSAVDTHTKLPRQESFSSSGSTLVESSPVVESPKERFCKLFKLAFGKILSDTVMVPYSQNPAFVDRKPIAQQLRDRTIPIGRAPARVALFGLGGVGLVTISFIEWLELTVSENLKLLLSLHIESGLKSHGPQCSGSMQAAMNGFEKGITASPRNATFAQTKRSMIE